MLYFVKYLSHSRLRPRGQVSGIRPACCSHRNRTDHRNCFPDHRVRSECRRMYLRFPDHRMKNCRMKSSGRNCSVPDKPAPDRNQRKPRWSAETLRWSAGMPAVPRWLAEELQSSAAPQRMTGNFLRSGLPLSHAPRTDYLTRPDSAAALSPLPAGSAAVSSPIPRRHSGP